MPAPAPGTSNDTTAGKAVLESGRVLYAASCQTCHGDQQGIGRLALTLHTTPMVIRGITRMDNSLR